MVFDTVAHGQRSIQRSKQLGTSRGHDGLSRFNGEGTKNLTDTDTRCCGTPTHHGGVYWHSLEFTIPRCKRRGEMPRRTLAAVTPCAARALGYVSEVVSRLTWAAALERRCSCRAEPGRSACRQMRTHARVKLERPIAVQMGSIPNHATAQMNHVLPHHAAFNRHSVGAPQSRTLYPNDFLSSHANVARGSNKPLWLPQVNATRYAHHNPPRNIPDDVHTTLNSTCEIPALASLGVL